MLTSASLHFKFTNMNQENFSAEQSLQVIHQMIEKAKNQFSENGHLYLLWGWLVFICSVAQFILLKFIKYEYHYMVWMLTWLAVIYQVFYLRKQNRKQKIQTYADTMTGYIWISFFILLMLAGFAIGKTGGENYYKLFGPVFLAIYGVPTFLSGIFLRFKPLVIGGIGCWLLSIVAHFIPYDFQLLLLSAAMIIAWIIPGYALQRRYKTQNT
jgi:FtsH-binding integral membrane protein